jgi:predicted nucleic acid-binding protein
MGPFIEFDIDGSIRGYLTPLVRKELVELLIREGRNAKDAIAEAKLIEKYMRDGE